MPPMPASRAIALLRTCAVITNPLVGLFFLAGLLATMISLALAYTEIRGGLVLFNSRQPIIALALGAAMVPAAMGLTVWAWRAHANLRVAGCEDLGLSVPVAALSLWIPLVNLFLPKSAMRQLWNRSHGEEPWFANLSVEAINSWWTCFIAGITVLIVLTAVMLFDQMTAFVWVTPPGVNMLAMAVASSLLTGSAWLLIDIIDRITIAQAKNLLAGD